jgi:transposase
LEEANVALAKLQERDEADKAQIFEDQQKKNQKCKSIMFQQINELTQQKQQAENEVKSCQAKLDVRIYSPCMSRHEGANTSRGACLMH